MYYITKLQDGGYLVECMIQDGTERWRGVSVESAVKSLKEGAKILNGSRISERDITFLKEQPVTKVERVRCKRSEL